MLAVNGPDSLIWWDWIGDHTDDITELLGDHVTLTLSAVGIGLLISVPVALLARWFRPAGAPILAVFGVLYTIPALAMFGLLAPFTGILTERTALIGLVAYTLLVLTRNVMIGLDGVPEDVREAAKGMGYRSWQLFARVELPLALPSIVAGLRVATVSTVGLVTIASVIGHGGLGELIQDGLDRNFSTPLMVGAVLSVALALTADLVLVVVQRLLTRWSRLSREAP